MTQQPYYPPQFPTGPQQPYYPPQFPTGPQQPQGGPGMYQMPQQLPPQQPPPVTGTLDEFFAQPSSGGGAAISWKDAPIGTSYAGVVVRDVTQGDIQQQTDVVTKAPAFFRDGRPKFVMKVPLRVQPSAAHPEGEAALYVRGQMRDELVRAMGQVGCSGAPKAGAGIKVTLVGRRSSGAGMSPANIFHVEYVPGAVEDVPQPLPTPVQPAPVTAVQQPPPAETFVQQQRQQQPPAPPAQQVSDLSPAQQELLARLTGG